MPIAVSACLLGESCRYDGKSRPCEDVLKLHDACEMVPVCPEVLGGLPVPHAPCEIAAAERALRVTDADGVDVTDAFLAGATKTVELAQEQGCKLAVLKAKSPSCGCGLVYAYCSDPAVGPDAGWAPHRTREDSRMFVEVIASEPHVFGIFEKTGAGTGATGPCIGSIGLIRDPQRRNVDCLMLGYALARTAWGRGCMTEAADEMLRYGFEELGLGLITCTHYTFNDRSRRVIEKAGFVHEGTIHGAEATPDGLMQDFESYYLPRGLWDDAKARG